MGNEWFAIVGGFSVAMLPNTRKSSVNFEVIDRDVLLKMIDAHYDTGGEVGLAVKHFDFRAAIERDLGLVLPTCDDVRIDRMAATVLARLDRGSKQIRYWRISLNK